MPLCSGTSLPVPNRIAVWIICQKSERNYLPKWTHWDAKIRHHPLSRNTALFLSLKLKSEYFKLPNFWLLCRKKGKGERKKDKTYERKNGNTNDTKTTKLKKER
jgi:hypothetical protein